MKAIHHFVCVSLLLISPICVHATEKGTKPSSNTKSQAIQLFGKLDWNDGVADVIKKLNGIDGIQNLVMPYHSTDSYTGITTDKDFSDIITKDLAKAHAYDAGDNGDKYYLESSSVKYYDINKHVYMTDNGIVEITAKQILISGVPFSLTVTMETNPGAAILNPNGIISDNYGKYKISKVIESIELKSNAPQLINNIDNIYNIFKAKYASLLAKKQGSINDKRKGEFNINITDRENTNLSATCDKDSCYISYTVKQPNNRMTEFSDAYQKHLANILKSNTPASKDVSDQL